eukprot:CAMPEP_0196226818 /NCGR_PEP_ID=MMETSP0912-20130531/50592_1 /TAXON_ID=49265 /ORGANISM="Thalassiosira rotula, Strain GSO102" /LENGTH=213 /DNA_ID=CAMNT_0041506327 /DNA_START=24 /DNA_END=666 /DNA_ORIENTATION=-
MTDRLRVGSLHTKITLPPKLGSEVPPQTKGLKFGIPVIKKQSVARVLRGDAEASVLQDLLQEDLHWLKSEESELHSVSMQSFLQSLKSSDFLLPLLFFEREEFVSQELLQEDLHSEKSFELSEPLEVHSLSMQSFLQSLKSSELLLPLLFFEREDARRFALVVVRGVRATRTINAILFAILEIIRTLVTFQENFFIIRIQSMRAVNGCTLGRG